jgi:FkbM family methyltransferase
MVDPLRVSMTVLGRTVEFDMTLDAGFWADEAMVNEFQANGTTWCEPEVVHLMLRVLRPGDLAVDAGANVGFFSCLMSRLVGLTGRVLAFEPAAVNLAKLHRNLALNGIENVEVHPTALWDSGTEMPFWYGHDSGACSFAQYHEATGSVVVKTETLDECLPFSTVPPVRLLKLDVEGSEERALRGARVLLASVFEPPYVTCEMNDDALQAMSSSKEQLRAYMRERGYQMFILHDDGTLPTLVPDETRLVSMWKNVNVLFSTVAAVGAAWPEQRVFKHGR